MEQLYVHAYWQIDSLGVNQLDNLIDFIIEQGCLRWEDSVSEEKKSTEHENYFTLEIIIGGCSEEALNHIKNYAQKTVGINKAQWELLPEDTFQFLQPDDLQRAGKCRPRDFSFYEDRIYTLGKQADHNERLKRSRDSE